MTKTKRKLLISLTSLFLVIAVVWFVTAILSANHNVQHLPDGTMLALTDAKIGKQVEFLQGTFLERTFAKLIPQYGIKIGWFSLHQPTKITQDNYLSPSGSPRLFLQFKLIGTPAQIAASNFMTNQARFHAVLTGDDGYEFSQLFWPQFNLYSGDYGYLTPLLYPRQTRTVRIRIEERDSSESPPRTVARFSTQIEPEPVRPMTPEELPVTKSMDGLDFVLGEVSFYQPGPRWQNNSKYASRIAFQVLEKGRPQTNWEAFSIAGLDGGGNEARMYGFRNVSNNWLVITNVICPDPGKPWRLTMNFGRTANSDFPSSNLFTVDLPTTNYYAMTTNLSGLPVRIELDPMLRSFEVKLPANATDKRINIVKVETQDGKLIGGSEGRWDEHHVSWQLGQSTTNPLVRITLVIHANYPIAFTVQPVDKTTGRTNK